MFLLDTNVVSELRKPKPHGAVIAWLQAQDDEHLFISAMTVAEIQGGIERTRDQDPAKAEELETWLDQIAAGCQVLAANANVMRQWARLMHRRSDTVIEDGLIAATARTHRLTVVTRDVADFNSFDVPVLNPCAFKAS